MDYRVVFMACRTRDQCLGFSDEDTTIKLFDDESDDEH